MSLVAFTDKHNQGRHVYVDSRQVVFVQTIGDDTCIGTTATRSDGGGRIIIVKEDEADVVRRLNNDTKTS